MIYLAAEERQTLYGNASPARFDNTDIVTLFIRINLSTRKRESTATIKNSPSPYAQKSPPKRQNIIEFDCRGLEFTEFKADVRWKDRKSTSALLIPETGPMDG